MTEKKTLNQRLKEAKTSKERSLLMVMAANQKQSKRIANFLSCVVLKSTPDNIETIEDLKKFNKAVARVEVSL